MCLPQSTAWKQHIVCRHPHVLSLSPPPGSCSRFLSHKFPPAIHHHRRRRRRLSSVWRGKVRCRAPFKLKAPSSERGKKSETECVYSECAPMALLLVCRLGNGKSIPVVAAEEEEGHCRAAEAAEGGAGEEKHSQSSSHLI